MAAAFIATSSGELTRDAGGTPISADLPGTPAEDDVIVGGCVADGDLTPDGRGLDFAAEGYTEIYDSGSGAVPALQIGYKVMSSSPDSAVDLIPDDTTDGAWMFQSFSGIDTSDVLGATPVQSSGASGDPDPGSLTTAANGNMRVIVGGIDDDSVSSGTVDTDFSDDAYQSSVGSPNMASIMMASREEATAGALDPDAWTTSGSDEWEALHIDLNVAAGGPITVNLGLASETDSGFDVALPRGVDMGLAEEADSGLALTLAKAFTLGLASETDSGFDVALPRAVNFGLAEEADSGLALSLPKTQPLGLAEEADSGLALSLAKGFTLGLASETDSAQGLGFLRAITLGIASETDSAFGLANIVAEAGRRLIRRLIRPITRPITRPWRNPTEDGT